MKSQNVHASESPTRVGGTQHGRLEMLYSHGGPYAMVSGFWRRGRSNVVPVVYAGVPSTGVRAVLCGRLAAGPEYRVQGSAPDQTSQKPCPKAYADSTCQWLIIVRARGNVCSTTPLAPGPRYLRTWHLALRTWHHALPGTSGFSPRISHLWLGCPRAPATTPHLNLLLSASRARSLPRSPPPFHPIETTTTPTPSSYPTYIPWVPLSPLLTDHPISHAAPHADASRCASCITPTSHHPDQ